MTAKLPDSALLEQKYTLSKGRVLMSGTQALVRLPMLQKESDQRAGLNTAGFISGYRGSPLAGVDQQLWKAQAHLKAHDVVFQPGVNEDLAATAVWGSQQVNLSERAQFDGVFGMWYGKGPGVDRSIDAIKHANAAGTSKHGGVLMVAGDDHAAKSSTLAHQSEHVMAAAGVPVLYPSNVQEFLDFGLHGWAMSRYSGLWTGLKCVTQVVETTASVDIDPDRTRIILPEAFEMPEGGLNLRWPDPPLVQEARMLNYKWYAALAYVRANKLNRVTVDSPNARFGIMAAGKAYQDVCQALSDLGLDDNALKQIGIRIMKVGCVWPLDAQDARHFAEGLDEILVVEEKRQILEYALKEELYNWREDVRPKVYGKFDARGDAGGEWSVPRADWLLPAAAELSPSVVGQAIAKRLSSLELPEDIRRHIDERLAIIDQKQREAARPRVTSARTPWFCSGCPHNTSTRVPEGSRALAGIGCHYMTVWMDRNTSTFSHMGGEGAAWIGQMHFTDEKHVFANLGDGTYFHSGLLAIRAAVSANANITYKILFNDAIAMTGGQPVDGPLDVTQLAQQVLAEGVTRVVVVSDDPAHYQQSEHRLPAGVDVFHRDELDAVQKELRDTRGTTILIYQQMCATEKRRRRKRGMLPELAKRVVINTAVCEGCGDCSKASNCLSVEPLATAFGTKRQINQSTCNQDFSCVKGFCPSFVTVEGAVLKTKPEAEPPSSASTVAPSTLPVDSNSPLPEPVLPALDQPWRILVTGVGGTGVVTVGALLAMAAHLEDKEASVLDMTGLAQKGGAVTSHVQLARRGDRLYAARIALGEANVLLGCDGIVSASAEALSCTLGGLTKAVINSNETPTAEFVLNRNWTFPGQSVSQDIKAALGEDCAFIDANGLALTLLGNSLYSNSLIIGYAWQKGWLPLKRDTLLQAIRINGTKPEENQQAFQWGRYFAHHGVALAAEPGSTPHKTEASTTPQAETADAVIARYRQHLTDYQDAAYAERYHDALLVLKKREYNLEAGPSAPLPLTALAAAQLGKLMAYKDEYEVARLYSRPEFMQQLEQTFSGAAGKDYQLKFNLAPPLLSRKGPDGLPRKREFGPWLLKLFPKLAAMKQWRGTRWDVFGYSEERQAERQLIADYNVLIASVAERLTVDNRAEAEALLALADPVRGFGHVKAKAIDTFRQQRDTKLAEWK